MNVIVIDLGPEAIAIEIDTPEGKVVLMNTPERLAEICARAS